MLDASANLTSFSEFKIPQNIYLTSLNYDTGLKSSTGDKNTIIEALKIKDINNIEISNDMINTLFSFILSFMFTP